MPNQPSEWYQQALTPPDVLEATIKVGVIPQTDHVQVWWEVKDPMTGVLIAQGSCPHGDLRSLPRIVDDQLAKVMRVLDDSCATF